MTLSRKGAGRGRLCFTLAFVGTCLVATPAFAADVLSAEPTVPQMIAIVLNFAIFIWLIVKFGGPAIQDYFKNRRASIADAIEESERLRAEAESKLEEYSARLEKFDKEREELLDEFRDIGQREKERLIAEGKEQAERIREDAKAQAAREARNARGDMESQLLDRAVDMATEEIERRLNPLMHDRLIDRSIDSFKSLEQ